MSRHYDEFLDLLVSWHTLAFIQSRQDVGKVRLHRFDAG